MNFAWDELLDWIDANLGLPLSVPMLAERANISPATLSRKFRQEYRMTLIQYLLQRRHRSGQIVAGHHVVDHLRSRRRGRHSGSPVFQQAVSQGYRHEPQSLSGIITGNTWRSKNRTKRLRTDSGNLPVRESACLNRIQHYGCTPHWLGWGPIQIQGCRLC